LLAPDSLRFFAGMEKGAKLRPFGDCLRFLCAAWAFLAWLAWRARRRLASEHEVYKKFFSPSAGQTILNPGKVLT
jgi:hypothetical protein